MSTETSYLKLIFKLAALTFCKFKSIKTMLLFMKLLEIKTLCWSKC